MLALLALVLALTAHAQPATINCGSLLQPAQYPLCAAQLANATLSGRPVTAAKATDLCLMRCVICSEAYPQFFPWRAGLGDAGAPFCALQPSTPAAAFAPDTILAFTTAAILNSSALNGQYFLDYAGGPEENATQALSLLLAAMPRRDVLLLLTDAQLLMDLSLNLKALVSQRLIPKQDGKGRMAAGSIAKSAAPTASGMHTITQPCIRPCAVSASMRPSRAALRRRVSPSRSRVSARLPPVS